MTEDKAYSRTVRSRTQKRVVAQEHRLREAERRLVEEETRRKAVAAEIAGLRQQR